jgi:hypothetical protein
MRKPTPEEMLNLPKVSIHTPTEGEIVRYLRNRFAPNRDHDDPANQAPFARRVAYHRGTHPIPQDNGHTHE